MDRIRKRCDFIETCDTCQRSKLTCIRLHEESIIPDTPVEPNDKIALDIIDRKDSGHTDQTLGTYTFNISASTVNCQQITRTLRLHLFFPQTHPYRLRDEFCS